MLKTIGDKEIEEAKDVLDSHTVQDLSPESALESLIWCVASQAMPWERASEIIFQLRRISHPGDKGAIQKYSSWETITNPELVNETSREKGFRFAYQRRFHSAIEYFKESRGDLTEAIPALDIEDRERYLKDNKIKYLGRKTLSFWHLCLGGENLLALDVHVARGLSDLGLEVKSSFYESIQRNSEKHPQKVRVTPGSADYISIESGAKTLFSDDDRFSTELMKTHMGVVDSVLWWRGAKRSQQGQQYLFPLDRDYKTKMPYGNLSLKC